MMPLVTRNYRKGRDILRMMPLVTHTNLEPCAES